jgi:peptide/nickel transport system permease protein
MIWTKEYYHSVIIAAVRKLRARARAERRWSSVTLWLGVAIVGIMIVLSLSANWIGFTNPNEQDLDNVLLRPSLEHPFGTDELGRDIFTRVLHGARIDLSFGLITTYVSLVVGMFLGALAGYFGGISDTITMRAVDTVIAFPYIVLILAIASVVGAGLFGAYIGVLTVSWALYARLTRGEMLVLREMDYMMAANTLGFPVRRIIFIHALPNLLRSNLVFSMSDIVLNILTLAALSYLGLGVRPPAAEWGAIIAQGQKYLRTAWWISTLPGIVVVLVGVGFALIGDGLADRLGENGTGVAR